MTQFHATTPNEMRVRILRCRQEACRRLRDDFKLTPRLTPPPEVLAVLDEEAAAIQAAILAIQVERERTDRFCGLGATKTTA